MNLSRVICKPNRRSDLLCDSFIFILNVIFVMFFSMLKQIYDSISFIHKLVELSRIVEIPSLSLVRIL